MYSVHDKPYFTNNVVYSELISSKINNIESHPLCRISCPLFYNIFNRLLRMISFKSFYLNEHISIHG